MSKLYKFMALSWREKHLYFNVVLWLMAVKVGLCLLPFNRLRGWIAHVDQTDKEPADFEEMRAIIQAIERVSQFLSIFQINCLPKALVGHRLLCRQGFDVHLKIGVLKNNGDQLTAHAWIEYEGRVVLGGLRGLEQFTAFPALGAARR